MPLARNTPTEPQPGGRAPAPGELALVQAFINSNYDLEHEHGAELLDSPAGLREWLARRDLAAPDARVTGAELKLALTVREGLRELLIAKQQAPNRESIDALNAAATALPVAVQLDPDHARFVSASDKVPAALGLILSYAAASMISGTWSRLKACQECRWAFYDHSRNGAGSWCSMAVCGGRVKQRAYYARRSRS